MHKVTWWDSGDCDNAIDNGNGNGDGNGDNADENDNNGDNGQQPPFLRSQLEDRRRGR